MKERVSSAYSWKKWICILVGLFFMFGFRFIPPFAPLEEYGMNILGIFIGTIFLWLTVSTAWPSLLALIALTLDPNFTYASVLSKSWGNWIVPFIIFSAVCADSLNRSGFLKRASVYFISRPIARKSPWHFVILFFTAALVIGCFMESMTLFIVLLAIAEEIFEAVGWKKGDRAAGMIVLGIMMATSIASAMTPIGHTFVVLGMSLIENDTGTVVNYFSYSAMGIVAGIIGFVLMILILKYIMKPDLSALKNLDIEKMQEKLPPVSKREVLSLSIFGIVVLLWFAPGILTFLWPAAAKWLSSLGTTVPAFIGIILLSLIKVDDQPLINIGDAMKRVPWMAVILVATTQVIASALTGADTHITEWMANLITPIVGNFSGLGYVILVAVLAGFVTNFISSTVNTTLFYGIFIPLILTGTLAIGVNPVALACIIGATSSLAFGAPSGRAHASLAAGTGWFTLKDMLLYGTGISVIISLIYAVVGYPIASLLM